MIKMILYVPSNMSNTPEIRTIENLLKMVRQKFNFKIEKKVINKKEEYILKSQILWSLSVSKRIKIKQTRKSKSLYPQLVIFRNDIPLTFYPQARAEKEITIQEFLDGLLKEKLYVYMKICMKSLVIQEMKKDDE